MKGADLPYNNGNPWTMLRVANVKRIVGVAESYSDKMVIASKILKLKIFESIATDGNFLSLMKRWVVT